MADILTDEQAAERFEPVYAALLVRRLKGGHWLVVRPAENIAQSLPAGSVVVLPSSAEGALVGLVDESSSDYYALFDGGEVLAVVHEEDA